MRVFVCIESELVGERILSTVMEVPGIELVGSSRGLAGTIEQVSESRAELVILETGVAHRMGIDVLRGIKLLQDPPVVVMVAPFMSDQYRRLCFGVGADYAFGMADESADIYSVIDILVRAHYAPHFADSGCSALL